MTLALWIEKLLGTAIVLGGFNVHPQVPPVTVVPQAELANRACGQPCPVRGAYIAGEGIYLIDTLKIDDPADRSVLLHELVHYLQDVSGRYAQLSPCDSYAAREREAYAAQDDYLSRYGLGLGEWAALLCWHVAGCEPSGGRAVANAAQLPRGQ
jgi:hypothetical protein